ncbi:hypothetical protein ACN47E_000606 [Coniothyrium glycines]
MDGDTARAESPLMFCDIDSDISLTPSPTDMPTSAILAASTEPTSVHDSRSTSEAPSTGGSPSKRTRSPDAPSKFMFKKTRTMTMPEMTSHSLPGAGQIDLSDTVEYGIDTGIVRRDSASIERAPAPPTAFPYRSSLAMPELSSFRPDIVGSQGVSPITPVRSTSRRSSVPANSPLSWALETPPFARPLHLVDTDISIFKTTHGEQWRDHALCLHCFRRQGRFSRVLTYGYEFCGREEALDSCYWEGRSDVLRDYR